MVGVKEQMENLLNVSPWGQRQIAAAESEEESCFSYYICTLCYPDTFFFYMLHEAIIKLKSLWATSWTIDRTA